MSDREDYRNGLSIPGPERLRRIEDSATRTENKVDAIGAELSSMMKNEMARDKLLDDHERRIRNLDFKFYGILAGILAFAGIVIYNGGPLPT